MEGVNDSLAEETLLTIRLSPGSEECENCCDEGQWGREGACTRAREKGTERDRKSLRERDRGREKIRVRKTVESDCIEGGERARERERERES